MSIKTNNSKWSVYIIELCDNSLYTGITTDIVRRLKQHNNGKGSKYVASRLPIREVMHSSYSLYNRSQASKEEAAIKKLTHDEKLVFAMKYYQDERAYNNRDRLEQLSYEDIMKIWKMKFCMRVRNFRSFFTDEELDKYPKIKRMFEERKNCL